MKKIYNKPTMILVKMETEHLSGGIGTNLGGISSESENVGNENGSVADMAKPYNPWTTWDE